MQVTATHASGHQVWFLVRWWGWWCGCVCGCRYLKCVRTTASDGFPGVLSYERQHGFLSYQQEYEVGLMLLQAGLTGRLEFL